MWAAALVAAGSSIPSETRVRIPSARPSVRRDIVSLHSLAHIAFRLTVSIGRCGIVGGGHAASGDARVSLLPPWCAHAHSQTSAIVASAVPRLR